MTALAGSMSTGAGAFLGIALGILLSVLLQALAGQWYMPPAFVGVCLLAAVLYLAWLDRQEPGANIERLARIWFARSGNKPSAPRACVLVARDAAELQVHVEQRHVALAAGGQGVVAILEAV